MAATALRFSQVVPAAANINVGSSIHVHGGGGVQWVQPAEQPAKPSVLASRSHVGITTAADPVHVRVCETQAVDESPSSSQEVAPHSVQVVAADVAAPPPTPTSATEPAAQSMHSLSPAAAYLPAIQLAQALSA